MATYLGGYNLILSENDISRYRANQGYVYLIHAIGTNRYKIGRSVNPVTRLETLKKQSPYPLQIVDCAWTPDAIADEIALHHKFGEHRVYGEWFEIPQISEQINRGHKPIVMAVRKLSISRFLALFNQFFEESLLRFKVADFLSEASSIEQIEMRLSFLEHGLVDCLRLRWDYETQDSLKRVFHTAIEAVESVLGGAL